MRERRPLAQLATIACAVLSACMPATRGTAVTPSTDSRTTLRSAIDALIERPRFRSAEWAILVVDPTSGDTIYAHQPSLLMVPASNMKIVTSAVALTQLGQGFRYVTTFATHGRVVNGVLQGDLVVTGRGDPTLSDHMRGSAAAAMDSIADSVIAHGIHSVTGRIYSGADNFPGPPYGASWEWDDLGEDYAAGVDELLYNEGLSRVVVHGPRGDSTVKMAPAANPTHDYLIELARALGARGVRAAGGVGDSVMPHDAVSVDTLFTEESPPLSAILKAFLKPSQNQIGEALLRTVGLERTGAGIADSGMAVETRQLTAWGVPPDGYVLNDGSGLARADLVSPGTLVTVFTQMLRSPSFPTYYDALPIAGVDGTIARRMKGTAAEGRVHAKTGSIRWVRSLSGYVDDAAGRRLVFSILANKWTTAPEAVTSTADSITVLLARLR